MDEKTIWTTKNGRKLPICELETDHLINIVKMLARQAEGIRQKESSALWSTHIDLQGEMALDHLYQELAYWDGDLDDEIQSSPVWDLLESLPWWDALEKECQKRHILYCSLVNERTLT